MPISPPPQGEEPTDPGIKLGRPANDSTSSDGYITELRRREANRAYAFGWLLTPLRGKAPFQKGWQRAQAPSWPEVEGWIPNHNIGVRTGAASGILVIDVDRDDPGIALELGIPPTATVRTRRGRHYYLRHPGGTIKNSAGELAPGVDVKCDGGCIVLPGAVHPDTGHVYHWEDGKDPDSTSIAAIPSDLLARLTAPKRHRSSTDPSSPSARFDALVTSACDAVRSAQPGTRNDTLNREAFRVRKAASTLRLDWSKPRQALAEAARQSGLRDDEILRTFESVEKAEFHPHTHPDAAPGDRSIDVSTRPAIVVEPGELLANIDAAEAAILQSKDCPIYQRGQALFRVVEDQSTLRTSRVKIAPKQYSLVIVDEAWLLQELMRHAEFVRYSKKTNDPERIDCTAKIPRSYLARVGQWRVPVLHAIVNTPTLRSDGSILQAPGYDAVSRLLYLPGGIEFPVIPEAPTLEDASRARDHLVEPISRFPFVGEEDRSVCLAAMLTALVRRSLTSAPAFAFRAPTMGSGKSLLTDVISILMTGRVAQSFSLGNQPEEEKKSLFAALLSGAALIAIDNVDRPIESATLCTVLTQETWQARVLGVSRNVTVPTDFLLIFNGNNLQFDGDIVTRVLVCDLDARCEHPEERSFTGDLREEVATNRPVLMAAALTILRAYIAAGRPDQRLKPYGRFEPWSNLVRAALVWVGEKDPCLTRDRLVADDPKRTQLGQLLHAWYADYQREVKALAEVARSASPTLKEACLEVALGKSNEIDTRRLGKYLSANRNRLVDGLRLERVGMRGHVHLFRVVEDDGRTSGPTRSTSEDPLAFSGGASDQLISQPLGNTHGSSRGFQEFEEFQEFAKVDPNSVAAAKRPATPAFSDSRSSETNSSNSSNSPDPTSPESSAETKPLASEEERRVYCSCLTTTRWRYAGTSTSTCFQCHRPPNPDDPDIERLIDGVVISKPTDRTQGVTP